MVKIVTGDRIGRSARLRVGCSAIIFDEPRQRILLTRRADNGRWCIPGGGLDPGESAEEACVREIREETGLDIRITRLVGVYSSPHFILEYADGSRNQLVALSFEGEITGGAPALSSETTEIAYFTLAEIENIDLMEHHRQRISDAMTNQASAFIR